MTSNTERKDMERMRNIIHNYVRIRKDVLIEKAHLSIAKYNQLKGFFELIYETELKYDKPNKEWNSLISVEIDDENKTRAFRYA